MLPPDPGGDPLSREDHGELLRRYVRAVAEGAGGRPLVVFVDDAHLLDNGSAILLHQLALTRAATVLATVRSGEAVPDPVVGLGLLLTATGLVSKVQPVIVTCA